MFIFITLGNILVQHFLSYGTSIGEQGGAKGVLPPLEKKIMTPLAFKMTPTPSEMAFDPPTQISSFLSWRGFFFRKKNFKKFLDKIISPADAGTSFRPKKPKSAIKSVSSAPP